MCVKCSKKGKNQRRQSNRNLQGKEFVSLSRALVLRFYEATFPLNLATINSVRTFDSAIHEVTTERETVLRAPQPSISKHLHLWKLFWGAVKRTWRRVSSKCRRGPQIGGSCKMSPVWRVGRDRPAEFCRRTSGRRRWRRFGAWESAGVGESRTRRLRHRPRLHFLAISSARGCPAGPLWTISLFLRGGSPRAHFLRCLQQIKIR